MTHWLSTFPLTASETSLKCLLEMPGIESSSLLTSHRPRWRHWGSWWSLACWWGSLSAGSQCSPRSGSGTCHAGRPGMAWRPQGRNTRWTQAGSASAMEPGPPTLNQSWGLPKTTPAVPLPLVLVMLRQKRRSDKPGGLLGSNPPKTTGLAFFLPTFSPAFPTFSTGSPDPLPSSRDLLSWFSPYPTPPLGSGSALSVWVLLESNNMGCMNIF